MAALENIVEGTGFVFRIGYENFLVKKHISGINCVYKWHDLLGWVPVKTCDDSKLDVFRKHKIEDDNSPLFSQAGILESDGVVYEIVSEWDKSIYKVGDIIRSEQFLLNDRPARCSEWPSLLKKLL